MLPADRIRTNKTTYNEKFFSRLLVYLVLTLGLSFTLLPFIMMILSSFKTNLENLRVPPTFWPEIFTLENYSTVTDFARFRGLSISQPRDAAKW